MSTNEVRTSDAAASPSAATVDMKLEAVVSSSGGSTPSAKDGR
jgi:hypothetical protein